MNATTGYGQVKEAIFKYLKTNHSHNLFVCTPNKWSQCVAYVFWHPLGSFLVPIWFQEIQNVSEYDHVSISLTIYLPIKCICMYIHILIYYSVLIFYIDFVREWSIWGPLRNPAGSKMVTQIDQAAQKRRGSHPGGLFWHS